MDKSSYNREYYRKNRERIRAYQNAYHRKYRAANPEKHREYQREQYWKNREKALGYSRAYQNTEKGKLAMKKATENRRIRRQTDPAYREKDNKRKRDLYANDPVYKAKERARGKTPKEVERRKLRHTHRYATDPEYRRKHKEYNRKYAIARRKFEKALKECPLTCGKNKSSTASARDRAIAKFFYKRGQEKEEF